MDLQVLLTIIFVLTLCIWLWIKRANVQIQGFFPFLYFVMYRTKLGLKAMDRTAQSFPRFLKFLLVSGVVIGFLGMALICFELVRTSIKLFTDPSVGAGIQPVLPFEAKGVFFVPFVYWILSIFIIAVIHEFSHGVAARLHGIPIKSSGFAFLGVLLPIVPAAFVEPDERRLQKDTAMKQLCVFAAGPFSNLLMAGVLILVVIFAANPLAESMLEHTGVRVASVVEDSPAEAAGLSKDEVITAVDSTQILHVKALSAALKAKSPGDTITLTTDKTSYEIILAENPKGGALLGVQSRQHAKVKESFPLKWASPFILWSFGLLYWLFLLSLGIGLFNLLPIGPIDGGRMLQVAMQKLFNKQRGDMIWKGISMLFLLLVVTNVVAGFIL